MQGLDYLSAVEPDQINSDFPDMPQAEDDPLTFVCTGGSSNPPSSVTWSLGGHDVTDDADAEQLDGECNGKVAESGLNLNASREMNGLNMKCGLVYDDREVDQMTETLDITCE